MVFFNKIKNELGELKESISDKYFTFFPMILNDEKMIKILDIKNIANTNNISNDYVNMEDIRKLVKMHFCERNNVRFYHDEGEKKDILKIIKTNYQENISRTLKEADLILDHKIKISASKRYCLGEDIDWSYDIHSGKRWPLSYYKNYRIYGKIKGDKLFTVKIHRHHHLTTLARAYLYSYDSKYRYEIINQILDWSQKNPYKMGMGWRSSLVCANRVLSWMWCLSLIGWQDIDDDRFWEILRAIYLHTKFIENDLSLDVAYPNNHLIGEAAALSIIGVYFPEFYEAEYWRQTGLKILKSELARQFFGSGINREQSINYHLFVTEFYTHVHLLCCKNDIDSQFISDKLENMYEYLMAIYQPGGTVPMLGDSSDAKVVNLSDQDNAFLDTFFAIGTVLFDRRDMKKLCHAFTEEALWLLTAQGYYTFQNMKEREIGYDSYAYRDAGLFVMRDGWQPTSRYMAMDCGPLGLGNAGHGHADILSFELWAHGVKLIVDPGTYTYHGPREWRQYFRGTSAHNTVVVDSLDQAEALPGSFGWGTVPHPRLQAWYTSEDFDYFAGAHDGYERLVQPITHQRRVFFVKREYWVISDILTGEGKHTFHSLFHCVPGRIAFEERDNSLVISHTHANIKIVPLNNGIQADVIAGRIDPIQGWISYEFGTKIPMSVLQYMRVCEPPVFFDVVLYPFVGNNVPRILVEEINVYNERNDIINHEEARCLKICIDDMEDYHLYSNQGKTIKHFNKFTTNGEIVYVRKCKNAVIKYFIKGGELLSYYNVPVTSS